MHAARTPQNGHERSAAAPRGGARRATSGDAGGYQSIRQHIGGWIMASMDAAAGMTTTRLAEGQTVTVAVSNMVFMQPIKVGDTAASTPR